MQFQFKKAVSEQFDFMILSFATAAAKKGIDASSYQIIVRPPTTNNPFYQLTFNAYIFGKVWYSSEGGITPDPHASLDILAYEREIAYRYGLPLEIRLEH